MQFSDWVKIIRPRGANMTHEKNIINKTTLHPQINDLKKIIQWPN